MNYKYRVLVTAPPILPKIYNYKDLFDKKSVGSYYSRIVNQFFMIFNRLGSDGGLFIVIGKKNIKTNLK